MMNSFCESVNFELVATNGDIDELKTLVRAHFVCLVNHLLSDPHSQIQDLRHKRKC